jgi:hypothetical protein
MEYSRHPLVVTFVGFLFTGILGGSLTWWLNGNDHLRDRENSMRDSAIAAVTDISELVSERRVRGRLVISAIKRKAPESEVTARKLAYDEAVVRWNVKMPGDLLHMRAGFQWSKMRSSGYRDSSRLHYEKYIDTLINADMLSHLNDFEDPKMTKPGLFKVLDECLTKAFDEYRAASFAKNDLSTSTLLACKYDEVHIQSIVCFGKIAEELYKSANEIGEISVQSSDEPIIRACTPP